VTMNARELKGNRLRVTHPACVEPRLRSH
jgi:hypothetical protein